MCEQQYFIEYVLGWRGPSNKKADKGTIVHKILEILAVIKQAQQNNLLVVTDEIVGEIDVNSYCLDTLFDKTYHYYIEQFSHHSWEKKDYSDCRAWYKKAIDFNNGMFDPRNRDILCPEQHFDIIIDKPWAEYSFDTNEGKIEGKLGLKGTIDLITKIDDNTLEVIDWKTGKRLDWATGQEKTFAKLQKDPQLMLYYYAISKVYPQYEHVIFTIYFINDGGPFSILFSKDDIAKAEDMLRTKFLAIKKNKKPKLNKTWMCSKLCHFGKSTFIDHPNIQALEEYRDNQITQKGEMMTKCEQIKHDIETKGMDIVVDEYKNPKHSFAKYKAPGSVE
jgi:hypothetical protein